MKLRMDSLDWAIKHAQSQGDTDIFPEAFEFQAIEYDWDAVRSFLSGQDVLQWRNVARPLRRCLSPKRTLGFRVATQLDPLDFLVFTALLYEVGNDLEAYRMPSSNEINRSVVSWRFNPSEEGAMFDPNSGYGLFRSRSEELAKSGDYMYVVLTDIADFYPRLYHHRVEGAITNATRQTNHTTALMRLIGSWNQTQTYGIPVGSSASRLIAEVSINDVDRALSAEGIDFIRYVDDYRLFVTSKSDGYRNLAQLANILYKNHGLTLQQEKTMILPVERFLQITSRTPESAALDDISRKFAQVLTEVGIADAYDDIEYNDLDEKTQDFINSLQLKEALEIQIESPEIDQQAVRFILSKLAQLGDTDSIAIVVQNLDKLFSVFPNVIRFIGRFRNLDDNNRHSIARDLLGNVENSYASASEFHRMWLFSLFSDGMEWGNSDKMASLHSKYEDMFSRRKLTLALAKSGQDYWFRTRKDDIFGFEGWVRRAFLAGASCLPSVERGHWYNFLMPRLDPLEQSVVKWARAHPFGN